MLRGVKQPRASVEQLRAGVGRLRQTVKGSLTTIKQLPDDGKGLFATVEGSPNIEQRLFPARKILFPGEK